MILVVVVISVAGSSKDQLQNRLQLSQPETYWLSQRSRSRSLTCREEIFWHRPSAVYESNAPGLRLGVNTLFVTEEVDGQERTESLILLKHE